MYLLPSAYSMPTVCMLLGVGISRIRIISPKGRLNIFQFIYLSYPVAFCCRLS